MNKKYKRTDFILQKFIILCTEGGGSTAAALKFSLNLKFLQTFWGSIEAIKVSIERQKQQIKAVNNAFILTMVEGKLAPPTPGFIKCVKTFGCKV
jgi:hypothetical protein